MRVGTLLTCRATLRTHARRLAMHGAKLRMHAGMLATHGRKLRMYEGRLAMHGGTPRMHAGTVDVRGSTLAIGASSFHRRRRREEGQVGSAEPCVTSFAIRGESVPERATRAGERFTSARQLPASHVAWIEYVQPCCVRMAEYPCAKKLARWLRVGGT